MTLWKSYQHVVNRVQPLDTNIYFYFSFAEVEISTVIYLTRLFFVFFLFFFFFRLRIYSLEVDHVSTRLIITSRKFYVTGFTNMIHTRLCDTVRLAFELNEEIGLFFSVFSDEKVFFATLFDNLIFCRNFCFLPSSSNSITDLHWYFLFF